MKFTSLLLSSAFFLSTACADDSSAAGLAALTKLPACGMTCTTSNFANTKCKITDAASIACLCTDDPFQAAVEKCVHDTCSPDDQCKAANLSLTTCPCIKFSQKVPDSCKLDLEGAAAQCKAQGNGNSSSASGTSTAGAAGASSTTKASGNGAGQLAVSGFAAVVGFVAFLAL